MPLSLRLLKLGLGLLAAAILVWFEAVRWTPRVKRRKARRRARRRAQVLRNS